MSRAGFAARFRRTGRETVIGLKRQASPEGRLQRREELEGPADPAILPVDWPASPARSVVLELCGDAPLVELLTIRQKRRYRRFEIGETTADLSVDEVEVRVDGRAIDSFVELELELDAGPAEPMAAVADILDADKHLRASSRSKLERAARCVRKALPTLSAELQQRWQGAPPTAFGRPRKGHREADVTLEAGGREVRPDESASTAADAAGMGTASASSAASSADPHAPGGEPLGDAGPGLANAGRSAGRQPAGGGAQGSPISLRQDAQQGEGHARRV